ncbi:hypothetical protein BDZ85DRAFT_256152 [Elsinoe ampelina]|uniref:Uncharacterized protein n=1 Tax=Elsinoe ampelina TaxID=302913 RepID=A0A6A6GL73_9PEZI|nr:hypothetical protein BDZ85DRAFT_256152 [Elsinoe ampelina]
MHRPRHPSAGHNGPAKLLVLCASSVPCYSARLQKCLCEGGLTSMMLIEILSSGLKPIPGWWSITPSTTWTHSNAI